MATFLMFGKYTPEALADISAKRTDEASALIKKHGGTVKSMYAVLGQTDLVLIVELPDVDAAIKISVGLHKLTGVAFSTSPAVDVKTFDRLASQA